MRRFFCCCRRTDTTSRRLSDNISPIQDDTGARIEEWENSLRDYHALEESVVEKLRTKMDFDVEDLRLNPRKYLDSDVDLIRELAQRRISLLDLEALARRQKKLDDDEADASSSDSMSPIHAPDSPAAVSIGRPRSSLSQHARLKLSDRWADRLADVNPTQGELREVVGKDGSTTLTIRPKWPEWLVDETFEVIKITKYGNRDRTLKLTEHHILGIRDGKDVTKIYGYEDLKEVWCTKTVRGSVVVLSFMDGRDFYYSTPLAAHIAQQVATRQQVHAALASAKFSILVNERNSLDHIDRPATFNAEALREIMDSISSQNTRSNSSNVLRFARSLRDRILSHQPVRKSTEGKAPSTPQVTRRPSVRSPSKQRVGEEEDLNARRLLVIDPHSPEFVIQDEVRRILFDETTDEASTRKHFVDNFHPDTKSLVQVRQWIEGMHSYLISKRGCSLVTLYERARAGEVAAVPTPRRGSVIRALSTSGELSAVDEIDLAFVCYIAFIAIEESIFLPLQTVLFSLLPSTETEERLVVEKMELLSRRSQTQLNISPAHVSSLQWASATFELAGVERNPTPAMKLQAIIRTAMAIYAEFNNEGIRSRRPSIVSVKSELSDGEVMSSLGKSSVFAEIKEPGQVARSSLAAPVAEDGGSYLSADDLLPIFIFVLCRSGLQTPIRNKELLWSLCHPDQLHGESGYYLTIYESAVTYVQDVDIESL